MKKKYIMRSIVGVLALGVVESTSDNDISRATQNRDESMNAAEWIIPPDVQESVEDLRGQMITANQKYFDEVYDQMNIPQEDISRIASSSVYAEGANGKKRLTQENSDGVSPSGVNVCVAARDTLGVAVNDESQWHGYTSDIRMSAIGESVDVAPVGDPETISAEGLTPEDAVLQAFENAASIKNGIHINSADELITSYGEGAEQDAMKEYVSSSYNLCVDSYEVKKMAQKDGMYKVDLEIVYGEVVQ